MVSEKKQEANISRGTAYCCSNPRCAWTVLTMYRVYKCPRCNYDMVVKGELSHSEASIKAAMDDVLDGFSRLLSQNEH
jgi:DNA-directed RNA polymerase subunit RPC12/RpoP